MTEDKAQHLDRITAHKYITEARYRAFNIFVGVSLGLYAVAVSLLYFWMFDSRPVVEVLDAQATKPVFEQGEPITTRWVVHQRRDCDGDLVRMLLDRHGAVWPLDLPPKPVFGRGTEEFVLAFNMPRDAPPGRYEYRTIGNWRCNPLHSTRQVLASIPFVVAPKTANK